ncbi:MAG: tetratricopeptide repeat protein [Bacteroidia bacterium]
MLTDLFINLSASVLYDGIGAIGRGNDTVQQFLDRHQLTATNDFPQRYLEALVELRRQEKGKAIIAFFKNKDIQQVFSEYYYGAQHVRYNDEHIQTQIADICGRIREGDEIITYFQQKPETDFPTALTQIVNETQAFWDIFQQKVQESRAVKEIEHDQLFKTLGSKIDQLLEKDGENTEIERQINMGDNSTYIEKIIYPGDRQILRVLTPAPFDPPVFLGREDELEAVNARLLAGQHFLLLVNGQGGIGKTSFAAKYWKKYQHQYQHLAYLYVGSGITEAMLTLAPQLQVSFPETMPPDQRMQVLLTAFANLNSPCLLILDNANEATDLDKNYHLLQQCVNFHILITSRLNEFENVHRHAIGPLEEADALQLFKTYYPEHREEDDDIFFGIYHATGGNTLVLEILAKNLHEINQNESFYPLSRLLKDLQSRGLLHLSEEKKVKVHWQEFEKAEPQLIIQAIYDIRPLEVPELYILSNLAVLPPENIPYSTLKTLLRPENSRVFSDTLTSLYRKGWIEKSPEGEEIRYKISPVVQQITRKKNTALYEDCEGMIMVLLEKLKYEGAIGHLINTTYEEAALWVRYAAAAVEGLEAPYHNTSILCERIGAYFTATGDLIQALAWCEKYEEISARLCESDPENADFKNLLAISYQFLGNTHTALGQLDRARAFYEERSRLGKELYEAYPNNVSFKNGLAISYQFLGNTHTALGQLDRARAFFEQFTSLMEELYEAYPNHVEFKNGLAISYSKLGETHTAPGQLDRARAFYEQYNQLEKELYEAYPNHVSFKNGLAISYEKLGETHTALGQLDRARAFFEKDLQISKELYEAYPNNVSFKNGLAISYTKLGNVARRQGDKTATAGYFRQAEGLYMELTRDAPGYVEFQNNLNWVQNALKELEGIGG